MLIRWGLVHLVFAALLVGVIFLWPHSVKAQAAPCIITMDQVIGLVSAGGFSVEVFDTEEGVAAASAVVFQNLGVQDGGMRAIIATGNNHREIGFEDENGCVTPRPYIVPLTSKDTAEAPIPAPLPSFRRALIDQGRMLSDYLEFRNLKD